MAAGCLFILIAIKTNNEKPQDVFAHLRSV